MIDACLAGQEPDAISSADEAHRFARRAEPAFDFGAHPHPLHESPERLDEIHVALMSAVEAYAFAEEAR